MSVKIKKGDRRANRTRQLLSQALVELIQEKHYDAITVQNVIDRANVGRSTFYSHYRDKEDLFRSDWEGLLEGVVQLVRWENIRGGRVVPVLELFRHVQEFQVFCRGLARSRKMDSVYKSGIGYLTKGFEKSLTSLLADKPKAAVPPSILANHLSSSIFSLLTWWLDNNMPYPPERMDEIFHELVMPGVRAAFEGVETVHNRKDLHDLYHSRSGFAADIHHS